MGVCIKLASFQYGAGEIVMYRGLVGALLIALVSRLRGDSLRTAMPARHVLRSVTGVTALCLWFYSISGLPLATAMTLNYTSSLWMAAYLVGASLVLRSRAVDVRLLFAVIVGFAGVVLVLRPTFLADQMGYSLLGLLSGLVSAAGYLQVAAMGRDGEPESRIVFYFCVGGVLGGSVLALSSGMHPHSARGLMLLLAIGVLSTVAQLMLTRAYARGRTLVNASLQYVGIAFSFAYDVVLFNSRLGWLSMLGIVLIVAAGAHASAAPPRGRTAAT
jgi:drug/metabolite transporter (DMT)-like permease